MFWRVKAGIRRPRKLVENIFGIIRASVEWQRLYDKLPEPKCEAEVPVGDVEIHCRIRSGLIDAGLTVKDLSIDVDDYKGY